MRRPVFTLHFIDTAVLVLFLAASASLSMAATLELTLKDSSGAAVSDAVVSITRVDGKALPVSPKTAVVDQINETFVPHVRAITVGSSVSFPNSDKIHHHVYSFSEARKFDLPLYKDMTDPVVFDKAGIVTLGCNIHDHMKGFVVVVDSPLYAEVKNGKAVIANIPAGQLTVEIWHPLMAQEKAVQESLMASGDQTLTLNRTLELRPEPVTHRPPKRGTSRY